ncbi:hypothetical protein KEM52_006729, partial [Ascosphaera acerosa]
DEMLHITAEDLLRRERVDRKLRARNEELLSPALHDSDALRHISQLETQIQLLMQRLEDANYFIRECVSERDRLRADNYSLRKRLAQHARHRSVLSDHEGNDTLLAAASSSEHGFYATPAASSASPQEMAYTQTQQQPSPQRRPSDGTITPPRQTPTSAPAAYGNGGAPLVEQDKACFGRPGTRKEARVSPDDAA